MAKTYVVADMKLFDKEMAKKFGMPVARYNKKVIENINKEVTDDDSIVFTGILTEGNFLQTLNLLSQIKGHKTIINKKEREQFSDQEYKEMGFEHVWNVDGFQKATINNEESTIIIVGRPEYISKHRGLHTYIAVAESQIEQEELYKDRILLISLERWGGSPVEIGERLPQIIDDMELFASMDDNKEEILS